MLETNISSQKRAVLKTQGGHHLLITSGKQEQYFPEGVQEAGSCHSTRACLSNQKYQVHQHPFSSKHQLFISQGGSVSGMVSDRQSN